MSSINQRLNQDKRFFLLVITIVFIVFVFTSDGHRATFDEDVAHQQSIRIATQKPDPTYVQGESRLLFEYPWLFPPQTNQRPICLNAILCSQANIGHSVTQVPFILFNQNFHIITRDVVWTTDDFTDRHYVWWRNTFTPEITFLELSFGPFFSALSVGVFYLICRTFNFSQKISISLAFLYGLTTIAWAYSETSLNSVPMTFFVLLGIWFFRKFQKNQSHINLIFCATSLGFAFLIRNDTILFIIPIFVFILYNLRKQNNKVKKILSFVIPTITSYGIYHIINFVRIGSSQVSSVDGITKIQGSIPLHMHLFGLLFSPGVGLLIFAPILFTIFMSFPDFYKKDKDHCILFLSFVVLFLIWYAIGDYWHGLNAWGPRYLLPIVPFMLLPLGASIEKRKNLIFKISLIILGSLGVFFNLVYLVQDVSWFIWGTMGVDKGLYGLARHEDGGVDPIWISPLVIWTFEYSQLTQSIIWAFQRLQPDMFLLKVLGPQIFAVFFSTILALPAYLLFRLLHKSPIQKDIEQN